ncbi:MAG: hypothetical protein KTQ13_08050, partial [Ferruginibacter sp.]|nr:hypothetical protein [Ferruginibacter sp.]
MDLFNNQQKRVVFTNKYPVFPQKWTVLPLQLALQPRIGHQNYPPPAGGRAAIACQPKFIGSVAEYLHIPVSINSAWYPGRIWDSPYFAKNKRPATDAGQFLRKIVSSIKRFIIQVYFRHLV